MTDTYARAYVEILEIIGKMDQDYKSRIPTKVIEFFETNKDTNYRYDIDEMKENGNMAFSQKTIDLLAMLELKYLSTEEEKELLNRALEKNEIEYQKTIHEKYNPNSIFKEDDTEEKPEEISASMEEYKESFFTKIKKWFRRTFKLIVNMRKGKPLPFYFANIVEKNSKI